MNKKCLAFYVSSHGFGHMTRCLAIMEELLETTDHLIYLASGAFQNSFARVYLARFGDRVTYRDIRTEVGLVNKDNSLQVDIPRSRARADRFHGRLGYGCRRGSRHFARFARRLRHQ